MSGNTKILTVEDAGFRKLCPKDFPKAPNLRNTLELAGYEVLEGDDFLFCKTLPPNIRFVALSAMVSKENFSEWPQILASLNFLYNAEPPPEMPIVSINDADIDNGLTTFLERPTPAALHAFKSLLFWPNPDRMQNVLNKAVPKFFEKYPNGRLYFLRINDKLLGGKQAASRVLTAIDAFGFEVIDDPRIQKQRPAELLSRIHPRTIEAVTEILIKTLLSCFFRYIYGACVPRLGGMIVVQVDPPCEFELPFIRDRWDFNRLPGIFHSGAQLEFGKYLQGSFTHEEEQTAYMRYVFRPAWSAQEFEDLLKWTIERINTFLKFTVDLCNYTNGDGFIDFIKQRKILLTLERIISEINYIVTEMDPFVRKILYFNLHDKIATLPDPIMSMSKRRVIFNRLFKPTHYNHVLRKRLSSLPSPFDIEIASLGDKLFNDLIEQSIKSVWAQYRVSKKGIRTRETTNTINGYITQKMQERSDVYVREDFAVNFLHEVRNSLHGYQLQGGGFEEFLLMHTGEIPDSLPDLSFIWYFLILADTAGLISGEWTRGVSPRDILSQ